MDSSIQKLVDMLTYVVGSRLNLPAVPQLAAALLAAQAQMPDAIKDSSNPHYKSRYASFQSVRDAVRPALQANGLVVTQGFEAPNNMQAPGVVIVTTMMHTSGEQIQSRLFMPAAKADPQGVGSAITYGRRYALSAICGIASEEDDDANAASGRDRAGGLPPSPNAPQPRTPATPPPAAPRMNAAQQSASPPPASPPEQASRVLMTRKELGEAIIGHARGNAALAQSILGAILPGKTSPSQLSDPELHIAALVVKASFVCDSPATVYATKAALQKAIGTTQPLEAWTPAHVAAAYDRISSGINPMPAHSAAGEDFQPPF